MGRSGSIRAGGAYVEIFADDSALVRGLRRAQAKMRKFGATVQQIGAKMLGVAGAMAAPFGFALKAASDLEETMNKFNVVFGENAGNMKEWADNFANEVGRSKEQAASFLAEAQDLLVPMGFDQGTAEEASKTLTQLAVDLASFNNMDDARVMQDLKAALTGSSEVMKKYGVIVNEAAVKQELLNQGLDPRQVTEAEKAQARMNIILRGTTAAQGDAIRSSGSFANQWKALKGKLEDGAAAVGQAILPVMADLTGAVSRIVERFGEWASENKGFITSAAKVVAIIGAAGAALVAIGGAASVAGTAFGVVATVLTTIGTLVGALLSPIGLVVAALGALAAWFVTSTEMGGQMVDWLKAKFGGFASDAIATFGAISAELASGNLGAAAKLAWSFIKMAWAQGTAAIRVKWAELTGWILSAWHTVTFGLSRVMIDGLAKIKEGWAQLRDFLRDLWDSISGMIVDKLYRIAAFVIKSFNRVRGLMDSDFDVSAANKRVDDQFTKARERASDRRAEEKAGRDQVRAQELARIEAERKGSQDELDADQNRRMEAVLRDETNAGAVAQRAIDEARKEWQQQMKESEERQKKTGEDTADEPPGPVKPSLEDAQKQAKQSADAFNEKFVMPEGQARGSAADGKSIGSFNAFATRGFATGNDPGEKTAKNTAKALGILEDIAASVAKGAVIGP